ncbi:MAG: hypothetical protein RR316_01075 [Clostridia bacterium]
MITQLNKFTESIENLMDSKFIFANKAISEVLKEITKLDILTDVIAKTLKSFTYSLEYERACIPVASNNDNPRGKLVLPMENNRLFTFVTCLLVEFDNGKRDPFQFFNEFFYNTNQQQSFNNFCKEVILPYKQAAEKIASSEGKDLSIINSASEFFISHIDINSSDTLELRSCADKLDSIRIRAIGVELEEFNALLNSFKNAIELKNARLIGLFWVACKYAYRFYRIQDNKIKDMTQLLEDKRII